MPSAEFTFGVRLRGQESPEKAIESAKAVAVDILERIPGGVDTWVLSECTTEPDEEVRWDVITFTNEKVLRGGETWACNLVYLTQVPLR